MVILTRGDWYSCPMIYYNIIPQLKNRYLSVRKVNPKDPKKFIIVRYYMGYSVDLLIDSLKRTDVLNDESAKIYYDLSTWKDSNGITPLFSFNKEKRNVQKMKFTGSPRKNDGEYITLMKTYDFAIDLDSTNVMKAHKEAVKIKEIFDKYKLPYQLRFSGSKGFHFCIDARFITTRVTPINRPGMFAKIMSNMIKDELLKTVDESIYDARRILKLAYSLCNNDGIEYVALPLDDKQFAEWRYESMRISNVMTDVKLFKRGLLERAHGLTEKELKANVTRFMKDYK